VIWAFIRRAIIAVTLAATAGCGTPAPSTVTPTPTSSAASVPSVTTSPTPSPALSVPGSVWLFAQPPLPPGSTLPFADGSVDYLDLWQADAPWANAADSVDVFEIASSWVMNYAAPSELRQVVSGVASRGMKLALGIGAFSADEGGCGFGVEGFDAGLEPLWKIRDAGGHVDFIVRDEPYAFGVRDPSADACHWSVAEAAQHAVFFANQVRDYDPSITVGGDEPMWAGISATDIGGWLDTYAAATGMPYAFLHIDVDWSVADWPATVLATEKEAEARGVPVAVIYNGGDSAATDAEWVDLAMQRAQVYEEATGGRPDHTALESWMDHPDHLLPETDPTTFSALINRYLELRSTLRQ